MTKDKALKLALEALDDMHIVDFPLEDLRNWNKAMTAIKEALAQPEQEPVVGLQCVHCHITIESLNDKVMRLMKRPWVGLTDDERESIANATIRIHGQEWAYATAIEAKLKEKNA
jgi:hypothetical protein